jgi:hypothetical protein
VTCPKSYNYDLRTPSFEIRSAKLQKPHLLDYLEVSVRPKGRWTQYPRTRLAGVFIHPLKEEDPDMVNVRRLRRNSHQ